MKGFKPFESAKATLAGIELHHMLRKGQYADAANRAIYEKFYALAAWLRPEIVWFMISSDPIFIFDSTIFFHSRWLPMLSYQHAYHAGSFADVLKHVTLCLICDYMGQKEKPLFYLETHAGRGNYDLTSPMAQKIAEYKTGVGLFWKNKEKLPAVFNSWMEVIHKYNSDTLQLYPGSPLFALHRLREQDRFNFCELHPGEFDFLKNLNNQHKSVQYLFKDGIAHMNAALPPKEKRGLIFIDPSYELKQEYQLIPDKIMQSYKKFATGVYCLWYPIINQRENQAFIKNLRTNHVENQLTIEFLLDPQPQTGMIGTGLWIFNPPHILQEQMDEVLATLRLYCHF